MQWMSRDIHFSNDGNDRPDEADNDNNDDNDDDNDDNSDDGHVDVGEGDANDASGDPDAYNHA